MAEHISYYMDEHVPKSVTEGLRRRGLDVMTAQETSLLQADDKQHLSFALESGRTLFTQDADFLRLHADGHRHCGIVYAPQQTAIGTISAGLLLIHGVLSREDMDNHIEFV